MGKGIVRTSKNKSTDVRMHLSTDVWGTSTYFVLNFLFLEWFLDLQKSCGGGTVPVYLHPVSPMVNILHSCGTFVTTY